MSRDGSIDVMFPDGEEYHCRLAWGQIIKLQEARNAGPFLIYMRLHGADWMAEDVREVIRLGLIGGGMEMGQAKKIVIDLVENLPLIRSLPVAQAIMKAAVVGPPDEEEIEKKAAAANGSMTSTMTESGSPPSMELVR